MCPPTYFQVRDVKNPHMRHARVDTERARRQWESLKAALEAAGVKVELVAAVDDLEDMVFAANQVFVGRSERLGGFIVPSEMRYVSRQREVAHYVEWFERRGYKVLTLDLYGECLEGHGDLIWHPGLPRVWAGYGFRTTIRAVQRVASALGEQGIAVTPLQLSDERFYHLDTCYAPLNQQAVMIYPGGFAAEALSKIGRAWQRVHELSEEDALKFLCNGIVAGGKYITPHVTPRLEDILAAEGLQPVRVDTSEFEKSGGSAFCMTCALD